jgi:hypothetical protein
LRLKQTETKQAYLHTLQVQIRHDYTGTLLALDYVRHDCQCTTVGTSIGIIAALAKGGNIYMHAWRLCLHLASKILVVHNTICIDRVKPWTTQRDRFLV